jgi:UDP-N-acetylmuramoylalanine--D-glutamate ligase
VSLQPVAAFVPPDEVLVLGYRVTGRAVAARLQALGCRVRAIEDDPEPSGAAEAAAADGVDLLAWPSPEEAERAGAAAQLVVVSPGVPLSHPALRDARPGAVVSEIELAYRLTDVPMVAITGTNGKTTVTSLVTEMLHSSGIEAVAAGNIGTPLIEAAPPAGTAAPPAGTAGTAGKPRYLVVEVSSFQLALTHDFRPVVGTWLNLADDHLDWHGSRDAYAAAKERIWACQRPGDVAVANGDEPAVLTAAQRGEGRVVTFGTGPNCDFRSEGGLLLGPGPGPGPGPGLERIGEVSQLPRSFPHDIANVLAALATAVAAGADVEACFDAATRFEAGRHRIELVGERGGVRYYDDSKATTPSAVIAALAGFESVVLVAGGHNKGLDLAEIAIYTAGRPELRLHGVVAIGEAAAEVEQAFASQAPVVEAGSMAEAVRAAAQMARPGDAVLLSPGCASFDWYTSYAERGDDFARAVRRVGEVPAGAGR